MLTRNLQAALLLIVCFMSSCYPNETWNKPTPDDNTDNSLIPENDKYTNDTSRIQQDSVFWAHMKEFERRKGALP